MERHHLELFIGHIPCYPRNMLSVDEFIKLILNADEDTISSVEQTLEESQQQIESLE